jgi:hypothetical protein
MKKMKEQEFIGEEFNLLFYYPDGVDGKKKMRAQIYNKKTDLVVIEVKVHNEDEYFEILSYHLSK